MSSSALGERWPEILLPVALAIPLTLAITMIKPSLSVPLFLGCLALSVAFLSPLIGLYVLVFSMLLGPEILIGGLGKGATLGRGVTLRFDDFLLVLVGLGWVGRLAVSKGVNRPVRTTLNRPIMYYTVACVFATCMGILFGRVSPGGGFFFLLKYYEYFFLFFMAVNIISTREQVRRVVGASLITCALVSLYALSQIPGGERVSAPFEGTHGEPNTLGGYLVFLMAVVSGLLLTPGAVARKWPLVALLGLGAIALQATLSRASFLAAGVVVLGIVELVRRRGIALLSALLLGIMMGLVLMPDSVTDRITYTFTQPEEVGQITIGKVRIDTSASDRIRSWQATMDHFWQSPLWGTGVTGGPFMDAMYPRVLTETGLFGMAAFLYLLFALFKVGLTTFRSEADPFTRGLALGFLLGLLGLVVHSVGANTFIIVRIMEPFWLFAALVVKSLIISQEDRGAEPGGGGTELAPLVPDGNRPRLPLRQPVVRPVVRTEGSLGSR